MITEVILTVLGGATLLAAGWGLALLWQRDDPPYDPLPPPRAWELPTPFEPGGTYGMYPVLDLATGNRHDDVLPIGGNNEELDLGWPPPAEIGNTVASRAVKLKHNQWRNLCPRPPVM